MALKLKAPAAVSDINVTPMVDIMLVLLIIFMVITPLLQKGVSVDLVHARNPRAMPDDDKENAVEIAITRDGKLYLKSQPIKMDEIAPQVKDLLADLPDKTVYVRADMRAKFGDVTKVVDEVRAAGADDLGLITQTLQRTGGGIAP